MELSTDNEYRQLLEQIGSTCTQGRMQAMQAVNRELLETYWKIGRHIVEFEQAGQLRAEYGKALIAQLAQDLSLRHGKGFSRSNLIRIRQFYLLYPKGATLSHQLSWSHLVELLKIDDPLERGFYEQQCASERWSVRELVRQKESALFLRLAAEGQLVEAPADLLREPYVFEILKIPEPWQVSETQLETLLCNQVSDRPSHRPSRDIPALLQQCLRSLFSQSLLQMLRIRLESQHQPRHLKVIARRLNAVPLAFTGGRGVTAREQMLKQELFKVLGNIDEVNRLFPIIFAQKGEY